MSRVCTPVLVGMASLVLDIRATFQKRAKFPFQTICSIAQSTSGYEDGSKLVPNYSRGFGPPPPQFTKLHGVQSHAWAGLLEVSVAQCACAEVS